MKYTEQRVSRERSSKLKLEEEVMEEETHEGVEDFIKSLIHWYTIMDTTKGGE